MPIEILMPALSPTMTEGNLAKWLKKEGDKISAGEVIAEIETDKATMEVEAVDEGTLGKIIVKEGTENVAVNSLIALILEEGEDKKALEEYKTDSKKEDSKENSPKEPAKEAQKESPKEAPKEAAKPASKKSSAKTDSSSFAIDDLLGIKASPLAKRIAKENGMNLAGIEGTGPHGRVIKEDVLDFALNGGGKSGAVRRNSQEFSEVKNSNIRKVIARRLLESKQQVPHFYLSLDLNIDKLLEMRASINAEAKTSESGKAEYKLSVNDLMIKAVAMALKKVPHANSAWSDDAILLYNNIDISVAVAIDGGLITPIIKNADQKDLVSISNEMKLLAKKAKDGKLQPEEFQGGGFSISNLGMYGIDSFNAIVNPPQSCILAIGAGIKKPIVGQGDQLEIATIMNVTLSSDHRSVDGAVGAEFLSALKKYVENPILMLI
jgi:pyruvate dehydrogenase E2 component (dihydrolipoamide acetyltransferase)